MPNWLRIALAALAVLIAVAGSGYYWFIVESHMPADAAYALDIGKIRRMVAAVPGDKPENIEVEKVAAFSFPATAIVAGDGWAPRDMPVFSYRLVYPEGGVIIDTALDEKLGGGNLIAYDPDAFARMQQAMASASLIVITHEHMDHIGGLTVHPDLPAILPATRLTREQVDHPERSVPAGFPDGALDGYEPLTYEKYVVVAPGVVLVKAPGHSPGSQMVYVQEADGSEFLFIGDVAWHFRNIVTQRERARLITQFYLKEDRNAVFGELAALKELSDAEPEIAIVPGHDGEIIGGLIEAGAFSEGFEVTEASTAE